MSGVRNQPDRTSRKYEGWYIDSKGKKNFFTGTRSKTQTRNMADEFEDAQRPARLGLKSSLPLESSRRPIQNFVDEYLAWGKVAGGRRGTPWGTKHYTLKKDRLAFWVTHLGLVKLSDLNGILSKVERLLVQLRSGADLGLGAREDGRAPKTVSNYAEAIASFCDWLEKMEYLSTDPLKRLSKLDVSPLSTRRAMTVSEIHRLLSVCAPHRRASYEVAFLSGLRAGELRQLDGKHLDVARGGLHLDKRWTKNRKPGFQPLPQSLVEMLAAMLEEEVAKKEYLKVEAHHKIKAGIPLNPLLYVASHAARDLKKDLLKAGINPDDDGTGKIDFHACRVAYTTLIVEAGASVKEAQTLARHSTPTMTLDRYAKTREDRLVEVAESVGSTVACASVPAKTGSQDWWRRRESNPEPTVVTEFIHSETTSANPRQFLHKSVVLPGLNTERATNRAKQNRHKTELKRALFLASSGGHGVDSLETPMVGFIVVNIEDDNRHFRHPTRTDADIEAIRLARLHPGKQFCVMQAVITHQVALMPVRSSELVDGLAPEPDHDHTGRKPKGDLKSFRPQHVRTPF